MWRSISRFVKNRSFNRDQTRSSLLPDKCLLSPENFDELSRSQLQRLTKAFTKLKSDNPFVAFKSSDSTLDIKLKADEYSIQLDSPNQAIVLTIPVEGAFEYYYDQENERWIGWADGHLLEEMLARCVLSKVQGYLDL